MIADENIRKKIQILRAVAILAVVFLHTIPLSLDAVFVKPFINFAVAMFLFLSGLLTPFHIDDVKEFYKKRILRVIIPYAIWTIVYTLVYYSGGLINGNLFLKMIYNFFTAQAAIPFYFIFIYIQLVLITPFVEKLYNSKYKITGFVIPLISSVLVLYIPCIITHKFNMWYLYPFTTWFIFYYLGFLLGNEKICLKTPKYFNLLFLISIVLQVLEGFLFYKSSLQISLSQLKLTSILTSLFICIYGYKFILNDFKLNLHSIWVKFSVSVGNCSFGIYLLHLLIIYVVDKLNFFPKEKSPFFVYSIMIFFITYFVVFISSKIFRGKTSKWLGFA